MRGRTIMIMFECGRCGKTHIEPYEKQVKSTEGNLQSYRPPEGWRNDELSTPMLCPECHKAFLEFMSRGNTDG